MKHLLSLVAICLLAGCAVTPEQKARRAAEQERYEQQLQVALAAQCDKETAEMMARQFRGDIGATEKERKDFRLKYIDKTSDKLFQSCYRLAWENHINQRRLEQVERWRGCCDGWYWGPRPYWWW